MDGHQREELAVLRFEVFEAFGFLLFWAAGMGEGRRAGRKQRGVSEPPLREDSHVVSWKG